MCKALKRRLAFASVLALASSSVALAQQVTLSAPDGSISITGELVEFDGTNYRIQSAIGVMDLDASFVNCDGPGCPPPELLRSEFKVSGSKTLAENLIPALLDGYSLKLDADIVQTVASSGSSKVEVISSTDETIAAVDILPGDSTTGLDALLNGDSAFALSTRPARNREARSFSQAGFGDLRSPTQEHIVALDGLLLVTSRDNPVRAITEQNAALAFAGRIGNWAQLGGPNEPINLYVRDESSGTREVFDTILMRPSGLQVVGNVVVLDSDEAVANAVADDPNGLGFTSFASRGDAKALAIEGVCGLQTPASAFAIKTEEYPLTRLLYMYSADRPMPVHASGLLDFAKSEEAQYLVSDAGFIDQSISSASINSQGLRLASAIVANRNFSTFPQLQSMVDLLIASERLSTTFRFETGSATLDARAQTDIGRLADLLKGESYRNKEVVFVGFTDSIGDPELNRQLSKQRAQQVAQALVDASPEVQSNVRLQTVGFGEISPLGCNETNTGRRINRRVEVWVRDVVARN